MKINQEFTVSRPLAMVWAFFHDIPAVTQCLPGMQYLGSRDHGQHAGRVTMKVGPFQATFDGEGQVAFNEAEHSAHIEGKGVDRKGGSRSKLVMDCRLVGEGADRARIYVDADVQLSGAIAQFGRTGLMLEVANLFVQEFAKTMEQRLAAATPGAAEQVRPSELKGLRLFFSGLMAWIRKLFGG